jgi:hypothetical protein
MKLSYNRVAASTWNICKNECNYYVFIISIAITGLD